MGMYVCLVFCFLCVDTFIGIKFGDQGVCQGSVTKLKCCTDYIYHPQSDDCRPCIGTFGDNCDGGPCLDGYYGHGCRGVCNCTKQQECDRFIGCVNSTGTLFSSQKKYNNVHYVKGQASKRNQTGRIIPVILGVIFSVGSILVVAHFALKQKQYLLRKQISGLSSNIQNVIDDGSEESGEDYSQMTRASNNYNVLSFNRKFNAISTVNATDEEDFYDDTSTGVTCSSNNGTNNGQDNYVTLALTNNHVLPIIRDNIKEVQNKCQTVGNTETCESGDTYVTLIPNHMSNATRKL
ncbi:uncharacterized protein LOC128189460 [Crassostrea angulata]|uniref:uncharacterized protein LOC128189460 n=1 Tax=Magallana angulata TaxID=2784310 RepID=UPI0022B1FF63|nr:uncharacterized protein LOC128189460 [Crassostrea angulata]